MVLSTILPVAHMGQRVCQLLRLEAHLEVFSNLCTNLDLQSTQSLRNDPKCCEVEAIRPLLSGREATLLLDALEVQEVCQTISKKQPIIGGPQRRHEHEDPGGMPDLYVYVVSGALEL